MSKVFVHRRIKTALVVSIAYLCFHGYTETQIFTGSLQFDGVNDYGVIKASAETVIQDGAVTVEFWYKNLAVFPTDNSHQILFGGWYGGNWNSIGVVTDPDGGGEGHINWARNASINQNGIYSTASTNSLLGINKWHHLAFTRPDANNYNGTMYLDGKPIAVTRMSNILFGSSNSDLDICGSSGGAGHKARIDEIKIWKVERTSGQVRYDMWHKGTKGGNLVIYYDFDSFLPSNVANKGINNLTLNGTKIVSDNAPIKR